MMKPDEIRACLRAMYLTEGNDNNSHSFRMMSESEGTWVMRFSNPNDPVIFNQNYIDHVALFKICADRSGEFLVEHVSLVRLFIISCVDRYLRAVSSDSFEIEYDVDSISLLTSSGRRVLTVYLDPNLRMEDDSYIRFLVGKYLGWGRISRVNYVES